ncbi:MAG: nucleotidyl transferase AbiEii/AbiGii toxin family protein [Gammaproteobacteria bacterium]|nr:nucleotidyl transferase AbiEii/AbiGii toxin family protein [Gammaproteobacteria bacterium]
MISKQEIISIASAFRLLPTTVEKDYVLSWVLYGISQNLKLSQWFFKGGTCLKKCYFETYRFSEDLDFTVPKGEIYNAEDIKLALNEVADFIYENTGVNLKTREIEVKESINKKGNKTYVAKYTYLGPLNLASRAQQRIKFDITDDEIIVDMHDIREVFHLYSDAPAQPAKIKCYSVNEILAEKTRAIYERQGRARDIYDIVNISRNFREHVNIAVARLGLLKKFDFKGLPRPSVDLVFSQIDLAQLNSSWEDQLNHQVELLPSAESFYNDLRPALSWWIDEFPAEPLLRAAPGREGEITLPRIHFPGIDMSRIAQFGLNRARIINHAYINQVRYAARNRLCVEIEYDNARRLIEPYSLRRPCTGNFLLYAYELMKGISPTNSIKAYNINEIVNTEVKQQTFVPRYNVEL